MSYSDHAIRPIFYRTTRPWWKRARYLLLGAAIGFFVSALVVAASMVIGRMHATDAQLRAAHAQGMAVGMQTCPER